MIDQVFIPGWGSEFSITNAITASAAVDLPATCREVRLTNTSTTATVRVVVTNYQAIAAPAGVAPTATTGFVILPNSSEIIGVGVGQKVIRALATAADGTLMVMPGNGGR